MTAQLDLFAAPPLAPPRPPAPEPFTLPDSEIVPTGSTFDTEPPALDFATLYGNEVAKRALEIAAVGDHSIALVPASDAFRAASALLKAGGSIGVTWGAISATGTGSDLIVEAHAPRDCDRFETDSSATIKARVAEARGRRDAIPPDKLDEPARKLLVDASVAMMLDADRVKRVLSVARSVAALAGVERIGRIHIAEALSYCRPIEPPPPDPAPQPEPVSAEPSVMDRYFANLTKDREIVEVGPERLDWDKGDIKGSYSADTLANHRGGGTVRKPFKFRGGEWVSTGGGGNYQECYRLVAPEAFDGPTAPYAKHEFGHEGREQFGGYHGMMAKSAGRDVVLQGPPIIFVEGQPEQAGLL